MTPAKPYHWFQGESVRALYDLLTEYGPDTARLEVHTKGDQMYLHVKHAPDAVSGETDPDPINNSHICPPFCT